VKINISPVLFSGKHGTIVNPALSHEPLT